MPTYTYECVKCGYQFDYFHSITASPKVICEKCKGKCQRLIGNGSGIIFKGSGFYETDYKRNNNHGNGHKHKSTTSADGNGKSSSTESKSTETKSASKETVSK
ncbi:MAG TPA: zinc ribbon domain-containing protein [Candidatus Hydrogenedens sp.]|nr:zinc ribbon domain-containing protein [Candidatus Hydrogenedens sp.]HOK10140.1 zinc ribbon domain-containing protein [Candidatus Hydrogenedens sp.]HOL19433.1 zinc ribbon domain-containing protein [Candidatus Hydrogenedens sp.]HPP58262.1 zinc ribbon domain-containing protein [Candidatus Hydrogenedens sp.]